MTGSDDEFEDFLNRRKPVFRRPTDETLEPPAELDRVVLRQAREAIQPPEPMRMFSAPRWSMPIALAATLLLAFAVIFKAGMPEKPALTPEVTVQNAADRVDSPVAESAAVEPSPPPEPMVARSMAGASTTAAPEAASAPAAKAGDVPAWRRDPKSWQAEIQRLRDAGDNTLADAEYAEFKRQQRAYAVAPDR